MNESESCSSYGQQSRDHPIDKSTCDPLLMVSAMETYPYPVSAVWAAWAWGRCPSFPHPSVSKADGRDDPQVTRALELSLTPLKLQHSGKWALYPSVHQNRAKLSENMDDLGP